MRRFVLYLILCLSFSGVAIGQHTKSIDLSFKSTDFTFVDHDGLLCINSDKFCLVFNNDSITPALPYVSIYVLIGQYDEYMELSYLRHDTLIMDNVNMAMFSNRTPTGGTSKTLVQGEQHRTTALYPQENVVSPNCYTMGKYKVVAFNVCPFRYDTSTKSLYLVDSLQVCLTLQLNHNDSTATSPLDMKDLVESMVVNKEEMDSLYRPSNYATGNVRSPNSQVNYDYLIVTRDSLKPYFQPLADWKTIKGVRTKILTVEGIQSLYSPTETDIPSMIKRTLYDYQHGNSGSSLTYVLLGGNERIIPTRKCYVCCDYYDKDSVFHHDVDTTATDLYYSTFDKMNWDTNNNGYYGELEDSVSLEPYVYLTRLLVRNTSEVEHMVRRIILYEKGTVGSNGNGKLLMCGNKLSTYFDTISDAQVYGDSLYIKYVQPYWNGEKISFFDTWTDFPGGASYNFSTQNLQTELAKGYPIIHVDTHGEREYWKMENAPCYYETDALSLVNTMSINSGGAGTTHIITSACHTNAFDKVICCLGEAFFRNPNSGVLSYTGCSTKGWFRSGDRHLKFSDEYNAAFLENLFNNNGKSYGEIITKMKRKFIQQAETSDIYRWLFFGINCIGDPEMPVFIENPKIFDNVQVSYDTNHFLHVNTGVDSCTICVTSDTVFFEKRINVSSAAFNITNMNCKVCVTKQGYVPYVETFSCKIRNYIQNETLEGKTTIVSKSVNIGSDVTTSKPEGPVVIENGKTTIESKEGVTIKNDFELKLGAELEIKVPQ